VSPPSLAQCHPAPRTTLSPARPAHQACGSARADPASFLHEGARIDLGCRVGGREEGAAANEIAAVRKRFGDGGAGERGAGPGPGGGGTVDG